MRNKGIRDVLKGNESYEHFSVKMQAYYILKKSKEWKDIWIEKNIKDYTIDVYAQRWEGKNKKYGELHKYETQGLEHFFIEISENTYDKDVKKLRDVCKSFDTNTRDLIIVPEKLTESVIERKEKLKKVLL